MPNTTLTYDIQRINIFDSFEASRRGKDDLTSFALVLKTQLKRLITLLVIGYLLSPLHVPLLQPATSWLWALARSLARLTVPPSVRCSPFATPWRSLTSRHAGNTPQWTTETASTSTSTRNTPP